MQSARHVYPKAADAAAVVARRSPRVRSIDSPTQSGIHSFNPSHQQYSVIGDYRRVGPQADGAHNYSKQHQWQRLPMLARPPQKKTGFYG